MKQKQVLRSAFIALSLLLIPLIASRFVEGWNWSAFDFVFAFVMFFITILAYDFFASKTTSAPKRTLIGIVVAIAFVTVWTELAVGSVSRLIEFLFGNLQS